MMDFGEGFEELPPEEFEGFDEPPAKGYTVEILDILYETSKGGNPMARFDVDIADGPFKGNWEKYPKRLYQVYGNEGALARLKGVFIKIMTENLDIFPKHKYVQKMDVPEDGDGVTKVGVLDEEGKPIMILDFSEEFKGGKFDEHRLINLTVGALTKYSKDGYVNIDKFVSIKEAAAAPIKPAPNITHTKKAKPPIAGTPNADGDVF